MAARRTPAPARVPAQQDVRPPRVDLARLLPSARSLLLGFALLAFGGGAYGLARSTGIFAVTTVDVVGAPPAVRADVRRALARDVGRSLLAVSVDDAVRRVEALPDVISATGDRAFPHTLRLVVRPERPVAVLRRGHETWLVSARGRVMRKVRPRALASLPRVWVPRASGVEVGEILSDDSGGVAARAVAHLQATPLRGVRGAVLSARTGLVFVLRSGVELRLGSATQIGLKLAIAQRIVPILPPGTVSLDLGVPERPVADSNPQPEGSG